ncbi:hypothetical protein P691DRAFT_782028 [Macrolepiota fuliginosa MF-IS2]|uniref:Uncharacterized protein n=1 Tax=Macrolepiota fuliginosa MF-IS2 TaxID=1400762 RepID=A0A9P5WWY6_9AGAR|nr:hypothetical protein P691DRAFT_782028 [Macrolepiota fuliginosa MF-IS2]
MPWTRLPMTLLWLCVQWTWFWLPRFMWEVHWFMQRVALLAVPSKEEWQCHKEAHDFASDLKVSVGTHALTSLNYLCAQGTKKCLDHWTTLFGMLSFCGNQFLELTDRLDKPMKLKYTGGGAAVLFWDMLPLGLLMPNSSLISLLAVPVGPSLRLGPTS